MDSFTLAMLKTVLAQLEETYRGEKWKKKKVPMNAIKALREQIEQAEKAQTEALSPLQQRALSARVHALNARVDALMESGLMKGEDKEVAELCAQGPEAAVRRLEAKTENLEGLVQSASVDASEVPAEAILRLYRILKKSERALPGASPYPLLGC